MRYVWVIKHGETTWECGDIELLRNRGLLGESTRLHLTDVQGRQGLEEVVIRFRPHDPITIERVKVEQEQA